MKALIEDSEQFGLPYDSYGDGYCAPVGERVKRTEFRGRPVPWLGELRVEERQPKRKSLLGDAADHRLYFGEPNEPETLVLATFLGGKRGRDLRATAKQTQQMVRAMWGVIHWCESRQPKTSWRNWDWTR